MKIRQIDLNYTRHPSNTFSLGVTHKYKNQKKSEISDLGGEGGGEGVRRAENF